MVRHSVRGHRLQRGPHGARRACSADATRTTSRRRSTRRSRGRSGRRRRSTRSSAASRQHEGRAVSDGRGPQSVARARLRVRQRPLGRRRRSSRGRGRRPSHGRPRALVLEADGLVVPGRRRVRAPSWTALDARSAATSSSTGASPAGARARHLRRHAGAVRARRRTRGRHRGPRRVAGRRRPSSTPPSCRTWAGTPSTARRGLDAVPRHRATSGSTSSTPSPRRSGCSTCSRRSPEPVADVVRLRHAVPRGGRERPAVGDAVPPGEVRGGRHPAALELDRRPRGATLWISCRVLRITPTSDDSAGAMSDFTSTPELILLPAVDVADGQGRAPDAGRGRQRDAATATPWTRRSSWARQGARVDPPRGPRRRVRPRQQRGRAPARSSSRSRGVQIELSGRHPRRRTLEAALDERRRPHQPRHRGAREPGVGRRRHRPLRRRDRGRARRARHDARCPRLDAATAATCGRSSTVSRRPAAARYVVTDVTKDGTLRGPNLELLREVTSRTPKPIVASGGVSSLDDIAALRELVPLGVEGAIVGQGAVRRAPSRSPRRWMSRRLIRTATTVTAPTRRGCPGRGAASSRTRTPGDDGSADPRCSPRSRRSARASGDQAAVVDAYRSARLLIPLVAEKGDHGIGAHGLEVDKTQELSIVTVAAPDGRRVLPVFTSVEAMGRWDAAARPVPADGARTALAAAADDTELIVIDPGSATEFVMRRPAVWAIAQGQTVGAELRARPRCSRGCEGLGQRAGRRSTSSVGGGRSEPRACADRAHRASGAHPRPREGRARRGPRAPRHALGGRPPHRGTRRTRSPSSCAATC